MRNIVLLFHSVDDRSLSSLEGLGNIHPDVFDKILKEIKKDFDIVALSDLIGSLSERDNSGRLLAVTFDDGPKSYGQNALPIMRARGIPSSCFLITDCVGEGALYWRYVYNFCVNTGQGRALAEFIEAEYGTGVEEKNLISFTRKNFASAKTGRVMERIFDKLFSRGEYLEKEKELFLSFGDLERLKHDPFVEFGIHTHSHAVMCGLNDGEIRDEISASLAFYEKCVGPGSPPFSIPFGRLGKDYDERTILAARDLSVEVILSAYGGDNPAGTPLYNVRRIPVHEGMLKEGTDAFIKNLEKVSSVPEYAEAEKRLYNLMSIEAARNRKDSGRAGWTK